MAIVHDWLTTMRGGERVLEVLCGVFPQAHIFTLTRNAAGLSPALAKRRATTSPIDRVANAPFVSGRFRALLPLFPLAVESFNLAPYGLVVSSSHCVAMGAIARPTAVHVAYLHSTIRYVREAQPAYEARVPAGSLGRAAFRSTAHYLRRWEAVAAARPHVLIANSAYTRDRIQRYYQRDALVIEPPIDTCRFERAAAHAAPLDPEAPFLLVSALVPSKRVDLALAAFQGRAERLVVVGDGPERARLERLAGPNVTLLARVDEATLDALCASSRALLHTGVDDFGMVMAEALSAGKPVIACAEGGALEIVRDGETGLLIETPTVAAVQQALDRFARLQHSFDPARLQAFAKRFDRGHFERRFAEAVEDARRTRRNAQKNHGANGSGVMGVTAFARTARVAEVTTPDKQTAPDDAIAVGRAIEPDDRNAPDPATDLLTTQRRVDRHPWAGRAVKRFVDVTVAASGLVLTAPFMAAMATLIRLESPGPALFYQRRTGLHQRPFTLVKLRTMDGPGRVTRVGGVLRPLGLDELPQLWNVLKGQMSLIGPRPEMPERVARIERDLPGFRTRHLMRPGITGWAQVNGLRGDKSPIAERLRLDIQYLREWSLALDARILARTGSAVLRDTLRELRG
ncbi:MAG: sugar transferase [Polyangiaceae bacterium]